MASHQDFVDYVAEQLREAGAIRRRNSTCPLRNPASSQVPAMNFLAVSGQGNPNEAALTSRLWNCSTRWPTPSK